MIFTACIEKLSAFMVRGLFSVPSASIFSLITFLLTSPFSLRALSVTVSPAEKALPITPMFIYVFAPSPAPLSVFTIDAASASEMSSSASSAFISPTVLAITKGTGMGSDSGGLSLFSGSVGACTEPSSSFFLRFSKIKSVGTKTSIATAKTVAIDID